jgi:hypothetical protein
MSVRERQPAAGWTSEALDAYSLSDMSDSDSGTPFGDDSAEPIDDWSRAVFKALHGWPLATNGRWTRFEEGWLMLRIEEANGELLEPLFAIDLDTQEERILLDFGSWATPIQPSFAGSLAEAAAQAAAKARSEVEGWLRGEIRLVDYSDESGWRGSKIIQGGDLPAAIEPAPIEIDEFARAVVKTWRRSDWRYFDHYGNGIWIEWFENEARV